MTTGWDEEDRLAARARLGDRQSFDALVTRLARSVSVFFAVRGLPPEAVAECAQETFLRAWRGIGGYAGGSVRAWMYGIARHVYLQDARQRRRHEHEAIDGAAVDLDPAAPLLGEEQRQAVRDALATLPHRMQLALQLRFIEGRSCAEIAAALGSTVEAVSPLLYRAKQALREAFEAARRRTP